MTERRRQKKKGWHGRNSECIVRGIVWSGTKIHRADVALTQALCGIESCTGDGLEGKKKSPSLDIQIIFRDSNKKLVPCEPLGSLAATICFSSAFSSSVSLLCVSSPTECVSAPCYFKANAAWGPFRLAQAAACSGFGVANSRGQETVHFVSLRRCQARLWRLLLLSGGFSLMQLLPLNEINKRQLVIKSENICFHFDGCARPWEC